MFTKIPGQLLFVFKTNLIVVLSYAEKSKVTVKIANKMDTKIEGDLFII